MNETEECEMNEAGRYQHEGFTFEVEAKGIEGTNKYTPLIFVYETPAGPLANAAPIRASGSFHKTSTCMGDGCSWMKAQIDAGKIDASTGAWDGGDNR